MSIAKYRLQVGALSNDGFIDELYDLRDAFTPKYFSSVELDTSLGTERHSLLLKANGDTVVGMGNDPNWNLVMCWVSLPSGETFTSQALNGGYDCNPTIYICSNAILIAIDHSQQTSPPSKGGWMIFTKNERNKTVLITSSNYLDGSQGNTPPFTSGVKCFGYDDDISVHGRTTVSFTQRVTNQLKLVPFTTCPPDGVTSYTPNVFYIADRNCVLADNGVDWYQCELGGYNYLTNGYWAIKDDALV